MQELTNIKEVYFIGIGGIGMSALARYFKSKGMVVNGYDRAETHLTKQLTGEGIGVHYTDNPELLSKQADLVVYTPAVPKDHRELTYYRQHGYTILKRSDVLGEITRDSFNICISGTHGKTTITTMTAHILRHSGYGCNAFLGGIAVNYDSNFWSSEKNVCVVEADEYDRSFLKLYPDIGVITAMDPDHLDIYGNRENLLQAFIDFTGNIKKDGTLISKWGLERTGDMKGSTHLTYHLQNQNANIYAANIKTIHGSYVFDACVNGKWLKDLKLNMGGTHNIENALVAIAIAEQLQIDDDKIRSAVDAFRGVKRRFEYILSPANHSPILYVDDYAHHPAELEAVLKGARSLFPDRKITIIFQPHLYSRTRDLADAFAESLDLADEVILLPIYPARELPIPGITSATILEKIKNKNKTIVPKEDLLNWIKTELDASQPGLLITAGAGNIDQMVEHIKETLTKKIS